MEKGQYSAKFKGLSPTAKKLLDKGVSREAIRTTLEIQNQNDLRKVITDYLIIQESGETQNVYFYPEPNKNKNKFFNNVHQCALVYNLFMKENYLHGNAVYEYGIDTLLGMKDTDSGYIPMPHLVRMESSASQENSKLVMQFIPDFYTSSAGTTKNLFDNPSDSRVIESYMRYSHNRYNNSFVLLGTVHPEYLLDVWSPFLVSTLVNSARIIKIKHIEA